MNDAKVETNTERDVGSHFRFGENWRSFVATVTPERIAEAERGLRRLFPDGALEGKSFLDIGCGSGLSMLAAQRLGAKPLRGVDLDPESVTATQALLGTRAPAGSWEAGLRSVFDLDPARDGRFDVVYSWGVLHHTGDLWAAMEKAVALVAPGGCFAVALYRQTPLCGFWRVEKRFYTSAPVQGGMRALYKTAYRAGLLARGRSPAAFIAGYKSARGMDWHHDVHDWLGGYPYESTTPAIVSDFLARHGFTIERVFERSPLGRGLFGTHCDEFVARLAG